MLMVHSGQVEQTNRHGADRQRDAGVAANAALLLLALSGHGAALTSLGGASSLDSSVRVGLGSVGELRLGRQVRADDLLVDNVLYEGLHVHARSLDGLEHLLVGGSHGVHIVDDGLVGHQGQTQDLHAAVLGRDHLGDGGHAHGISTDRAKELALGLGLVAGARHEAVSAVGSDLVVKLEHLGGIEHKVLELHIVSITYGGKSGAQSVIVDTSQGVIARDSGLLCMQGINCCNFGILVRLRKKYLPSQSGPELPRYLQPQNRDSSHQQRL